MTGDAGQQQENIFRRAAIDELLFGIPGRQAYAVVDGASMPGLLQKLANYPADHCCLLRGELPQELADAAPYLIKLELYDHITEWLLNVWDHHAGIFAVVDAQMSFDAVRRHFRRFLVISGPGNARLYFRYYDPRILRVCLPTCNVAQTEFIFGPVDLYITAGNEPRTIAKFWSGKDGVHHQQLPYH